MNDTVTLWRPTGQAELDLVAGSGWRAWPPRLPDQPIFYPVANRWYAVRIAREWNVPAEGVGYVTRFAVDAEFLARYPVQQAGGRDVLEHWVPAEDLDEFNAHIVGPIVCESEYRAGVAGTGLPDGWREYLAGESWFRAGFLADGTRLTVFSPDEVKSTVDERVTVAEDGDGRAVVLDARTGTVTLGDARYDLDSFVKLLEW
ncbi:hypothetical protein [Saccharothrix variisporea]|uniref:Uncharacterized protein n=1 Tax=Saccharothrix variisporea TaxID=543527 RepID=A0A495X713_9PSEU|nr:hypothetical protein [Saccharothrix variisporea]RKT67298.1 hypothetical protein DFJ66_0473 [Saccharothrix variisporea]